jgi:hypothetical protein
MYAILILFAGLLEEPGIVTVNVPVFTDTATHLEKAENIVLARCLSVPKDRSDYLGMYPAKFALFTTLKGKKRPGALTIATIYDLEPGTDYLLFDRPGGSEFETDFLATGQLSVIPIPKDFKYSSLKGKSTRDQVQILFARHLYEIKRQLEPLLEQKTLLDKAVADREDITYLSTGKVKIGKIEETSSYVKDVQIMLKLDGEDLEWSERVPGEGGYFYFSPGTIETQAWEFAPSDAKTLEGLDGKQLKATFYDKFTPNRDPRFGEDGGGAIEVKVGQIILGRTAREPEKIFAIQIHKQPKEEESVTVRYFVWKE